MAGTWIFLPPASGTSSLYFGDPVTTAASLPLTGSNGEIRLALDTNVIYRFNSAGSTWTAIYQPSPTSSTDNAVARFDGVAGKLQNSGVIIDDSNNVTGVVGLTATGTVGANALTATTSVTAASAAITNGITAKSLTLTNSTGFLRLPQLTTTERDALTPAEGMMIFNTSVSRFQGYFAAAWGSLHGWGT